MTAECGLKRLMLAFGMPYDSARDRPTKRQDQVHANKIWARFESYRSGHHQGTAYVLPTPDPFTDWDVAQRYAHQSNFGQARVVAHQCGASQVRALVQKHGGGPDMLTFDEILPAIREALAGHAKALEGLEWLLVNRDLYGRVRLIAPEVSQENEIVRGRWRGWRPSLQTG